MTKQEFIARGEAMTKTAAALGGIDGYFRLHASRLHGSCERFNLFGAKLGDVLEVGPFYGFTPFILRSSSRSYAVLEGPDPVVRALEPLYRQHEITFSYLDLFESFGPLRSAPHKLDFPDARFDTVLCWETMEHFNFNPVKFVRELKRVLKPGGRASRCPTRLRSRAWWP